MEQTKNIGLYTDLTNQEMVDVNGGGKVMEAIFTAFGFVIGAIAKVQEKNGDSGQWMA